MKKPPRFAAPHQPRLDWQMWFAALQTYKHNPWFIHFLSQLLDGTPQVLNLLEQNPFPNESPKYIRAVVYDYHFTNIKERRKNGAWWKRKRKGLYCPVLSKHNVK
ncbi:MAG: hypothetical protein GKR87_08585 [Kiritimatiellae bacterium]|nr:hypothetical protein [Kiritimatiellia bacterium]